MTNPNNTVRVRARNGGRASVYEANGWAQGFTGGLFEGTGVIQNTVADMNVLVGGSATKPDVVLAENPSGYKIALDLVSQQAVTITAPASNSRISAIVAYTDDLSLATTQDTVTGSPASCGLIVVNGTTANNPVEPTDAQIRTAITADGATGSQAAYCVIAYILVANNTTAIDNSLIYINKALLNTKNISATSSVDTVGWRKIQLSSNVNLYLSRQSFPITMSGDTWKETTVINKPVDLNLSNNCHGGAGGRASDHAINVCGAINFENGSVRIQTQNSYTDSVSTTIDWWAYIVEIVN